MGFNPFSQGAPFSPSFFMQKKKEKKGRKGKYNIERENAQRVVPQKLT